MGKGQGTHFGANTIIKEMRRRVRENAILSETVKERRLIYYPLVITSEQ